MSDRTGLTAAGDYSTPVGARAKIQALYDLIPDPQDTSSSGAQSPNSFLDEMTPAAANGLLLELEALLAVYPALAISHNIVTPIAKDIALSGKAVTAVGGRTPYTYTVQAGALPTGVALNASTGAVTGTPTTPQTKAGLVFRVTDTDGLTKDTVAFDWVITA